MLHCILILSRGAIRGWRAERRSLLTNPSGVLRPGGSRTRCYCTRVSLRVLGAGNTRAIVSVETAHAGQGRLRLLKLVIGSWVRDR